MWPGGVIKADPDHMDKDGFIHVTFGVVARVSGRLSIQGRRLDASARRLGLRSRAAMATVASRLVGVSFPRRGMLGDHRSGGRGEVDLGELRHQGLRRLFALHQAVFD